MKTTAPPEAPLQPKILEIHNHRRIDPYYWLRDRNNPAVIQYLEAENAYTEGTLASTAPLQERLYDEMVARIQETDSSAPVAEGGFDYYTRTEKGLDYAIYCRIKHEPAASEEVILDLNLLAKKSDYLRLGLLKISPDHETLAFSLDTHGDELYTIFFKDLQSGKLHNEQLTNTEYSGEWANDNQSFFYTTQDPAKRPYRLFRHRIGTEQSSDIVLYEEKDELFRVNLEKTRDMAFFLLCLKSIETSEVHFLDAGKPEADFKVIEARKPGREYSVSHHKGTFFILSNDDSPNFKLISAPVTSPGQENWEERVPHQPAVRIDSMDAFSEFIVLHQRKHGLKTMRAIEVSNWQVHDVAFPDPIYTYSKGENPEFFAKKIRIQYSSLITPPSTYDYDIFTRTFELRKQTPVLGGFKPENYRVERVYAAAPDGERIPISLVHRTDARRDGPAPCLLYGYGSYGFTVEPGFQINVLSLLDRGFIFAIAHIRGGGEMGRTWYDQGKFLRKKNTFIDFIACAEHLKSNGFTDTRQLAVMGGSAGGLLVGAALNRAPDLCHTAIAHVPFVDVITTMLDPSIPLTVNEWEEWGNPEDPEYYDYMLSYSPYDNIKEGAYPHLLITAGLNDPRVQFWEPAKWAAKLRSKKTDSNILLLKTNMGAGHGGASGRYGALRERALDYAFLLFTLGLEKDG